MGGILNDNIIELPFLKNIQFDIGTSRAKKIVVMTFTAV